MLLGALTMPLSTLSVSDLISLYWRLSALPWTSAIALYGDGVSPGEGGGGWALPPDCFAREPACAFHAASSRSSWLSFHQLSGVPAAVTPCLILCPIVRMMAWGWSHLSSGVKCVGFMTVIFYTEDIFFSSFSLLSSGWLEWLEVWLLGNTLDVNFSFGHSKCCKL